MLTLIVQITRQGHIRYFKKMRTDIYIAFLKGKSDFRQRYEVVIVI